MPIHPIGHGWTLTLDGDFRRRLQDHQHVFWSGGRTVYAIVYLTDAVDAEAALAEMVHDRQLKPLERFQRRSSGLIGDAFLLPEGDDVQPYLSLNTWTASPGSVACVTFYFHHRRDLNWALSAWHTVSPTSPIPALQ